MSRDKHDFLRRFKGRSKNNQRQSLAGRQEQTNQRVSIAYYARPKEDTVINDTHKYRLTAIFRKKPRLQMNKKRAILLGLVALFLFFIATTVASPVDMNITIQGTHVRDESVYRDYINNSFSGWTRRNKVTIDTTAIEKGIIEKFPEVYDVHLYTPMFSRKMSVIIKIRPIAVVAQNSGSYLLIDTNGVIVSKTDAVSVDGQLITINDDHLPSTKVGDRVYSTDIISFFYTLQQVVTQKNKKIEQLHYTDTAHMVSVRFSDTNNYDVLFDISLGAVEQYSAYEAVQAELAKQGITPQKYIDVRLSEKVFYQ